MIVRGFSMLGSPQIDTRFQVDAGGRKKRFAQKWDIPWQSVIYPSSGETQNLEVQLTQLAVPVMSGYNWMHPHMVLWIYDYIYITVYRNRGYIKWPRCFPNLWRQHKSRLPLRWPWFSMAQWSCGTLVSNVWFHQGWADRWLIFDRRWADMRPTWYDNPNSYIYIYIMFNCLGSQILRNYHLDLFGKINRLCLRVPSGSFCAYMM
jgi:hypothetical protein